MWHVCVCELSAMHDRLLSLIIVIVLVCVLLLLHSNWRKNDIIFANKNSLIRAVELDVLSNAQKCPENQ